MLSSVVLFWTMFWSMVNCVFLGNKSFNLFHMRRWYNACYYTVQLVIPHTSLPVCTPIGAYLARYVKLRVAHAPGIPGTFSSPPRISYPDMHHGTCVTHVPWCMPGSLTSGFLWCRWRGNVPGIPGACTAYKFTYLVRVPCSVTHWLWIRRSFHNLKV